ncbi:MAG: hypothetical protein OXN84_21255 [Albidovulum sp.]|nr:hypothetical protein [Albidovulum sp.]MDE0531182.1 hypothetical protein [Albidovulum sp.]
MKKTVFAACVLMAFAASAFAQAPDPARDAIDDLVKRIAQEFGSENVDAKWEDPDDWSLTHDWPLPKELGFQPDYPDDSAVTAYLSIAPAIPHAIQTLRVLVYIRVLSGEEFWKWVGRLISLFDNDESCPENVAIVVLGEGNNVEINCGRG